MTLLPPALRPWSEPLSLLDEQVSADVGHWLAPLRSLFGAIAPPERASSGEPDGYDGISRRGTYDRLLLSEWALALEVPEEFVRRAVMREHVFTRPAFRAPQGSARCIALLDAGPMQLGAPRLAHLAALIVMQVRADAHGSTFGYGVLQHPDAQFRSVDRGSLLAWTRRTSWLAAPDDMGPWRQRLEADGATECWLIGPPSLRRQAAVLEANLLAIEEVEHTLRVTAHRRGRASLSVTLALPEPAACVRILRSPMAAERRVRRMAAPVLGQLGVLDCKGRRLFLNTKDGIVAHHVPNSIREPQGSPKWALYEVAVGDTLLGADVKSRLIALARRPDGTLTLRGSGLAERWSIGDYFDVPFDTPPSLRATKRARLVVTMANAQRFKAWIHDDSAALWRLEIRVDGEGVAGPKRFVCVEESCDELIRLSREKVAWRSASNGEVVAPGYTLNLADVDPRTAMVAPYSHGYRADGGLMVAWISNDALYTAPSTSHMMRRAPEGEAFGLTFHWVASEARPCVLVLRNRREVWEARSDGSESKLFVARQPIADIRHEPASARIVWRSGETHGVFCLRRSEIVLEMDFDPEVSPA